MPDQSQLDQRYFIDAYVYNCPFCDRRHVSYCVVIHFSFDWTEKKRCHAYIVQCESCTKESMHLTFQELPLFRAGQYGATPYYRFKFEAGIDGGELLDRTFFYSVPTSFFVLDERVPRILRELLTEAEGCLKSNFLTGASACARKLVYELACLEGAEGVNYEERLKSLKVKRPDVEGDYFDTLLTIQQITSEKVHEESYDGWNAKHLRLILSTLKEILTIMYVIPEVRKEKRQSILALKEEILGQKSNPGGDASPL